MEGVQEEFRGEHTQGPWRVIPGDSVVHVVSQYDTVCATNRKAYYQRHDDIDIANARLISAAPDMLAALTRLVYEATHLSPREDDGSHKCRISADALAEARAAISRAES